MRCSRRSRTRAFEHKTTITIGRSHGIHAEPTTFGIKLAEAYAEFARARARLVNARAEIATCAISGAIGTFANIDPQVEAYVAEKLGLARRAGLDAGDPARPARHVLCHARRHRLIDRAAGDGNPPSAAHRSARGRGVLLARARRARRPCRTSATRCCRENLTGLARLVRGMVTPALENVALWHERDISHSSVERMIGPDATITLDFALARLAGVIDNLVVYPENMRANLDSLGGLHNSQRVLLALTQAGLSREASYSAVQRNAMQVWQMAGDRAGQFAELLKADPEVAAALTPAQIDAMFDDAYHLKHVDTIFRRVFGEA